jgi:subtilase family serine protease
MTFRAKLPAGDNSGKYVIAVIDPDNLVAETDKTNNTIVLGQVP